jgi:DNA-binding response OmpR family regulator
VPADRDRGSALSYRREGPRPTMILNLSIRTGGEMATVLVVDKDPLQLGIVSFLLKQDRHDVLTTAEPETAFELVQRESVDLVIIEPEFSHHDGTRVCQHLRQLAPRVPMMVVSERCDDEQQVRALLAGADDFVAKPYAPRILMARVHAALRRTSAQGGHRAASGTLSVGEVSINMHLMQVQVNGRSVHFTPRELSLLHALMSNGNRVLSRDQLMRMAWGHDFLGGQKAVDVCVQRIRKKLAPHMRSNGYIEAVRGFGYKFAKPREAKATPMPRAALKPKLLPAPSSLAG